MIIIGGGIAGISAAWELAKSGERVTLIEARSELGGRLCSYSHPDLPTPFDNGPHLLLSTYRRTLRLLRELGISGEFEFPWPGSIPYALADGRVGHLPFLPLPAPWNFAVGLLSFPLLSWSARRRIFRTARTLISSEVDSSQSIADWSEGSLGLESHWGAEDRSVFWLPLIKATLNAKPEEVSIRTLQVVFRRGFCGGFFGGRPGYATQPLSRIFGEKILTALEDYGINVRLKSIVTGTVLRDQRIAAVRLKSGEEIPCSRVVCALPPWAALKWLSSFPEGEPIIEAYQLRDWKANPIRSVYLWAERRPLLNAYTCLPDSRADWFFDFGAIWRNRKGPICLILHHNPRRRAKEQTQEEEIPQLLAEIYQRFPQLKQVKWTACQQVEERRAIPLRPRALWGKTLPQITSISNLFLSGDWLHPDLPPTLEAGVGGMIETVKKLP